MPYTHEDDSQRYLSLIAPHRPLLLGLARKLCRNGGTDPEDLV